MATPAGMVRNRLLDAIKGHAGIAVGVGILLIVTGVLAICAPFYAGVSVMLMIGSMLLVGGIALVVLAFRVGAFGAGSSVLLMGALMIAVGLYMLNRPIASLASMTLLLASYLIVTGIVEIFAGFGARPQSGWGWIVASAVVTLILGVMLWRQFPISGIWAVGTLFGIKLVMTGVSMTSIAATVRKGVRTVEAAFKPR
jgi:uncharacterized membrane protein HdeD (DUF308 family)